MKSVKNVRIFCFWRLLLISSLRHTPYFWLVYIYLTVWPSDLKFPTEIHRQKHTDRQIESGRHTKNSYVGPHRYPYPQTETDTLTHADPRTDRHPNPTHPHLHTTTLTEPQTHTERQSHTLGHRERHRYSHTPKKVPRLRTKAPMYTKYSHAASKHWHFPDKKYWHFTRRNTRRDISPAEIHTGTGWTLYMFAYLLSYSSCYLMQWLNRHHFLSKELHNSTLSLDCS